MTISNTEILLFIMGYQGGTVYQCADMLKLSVNDILFADYMKMQDYMRLAQSYRNNRNF